MSHSNRRDFLGGIAMAGAASTLNANAQPGNTDGGPLQDGSFDRRVWIEVTTKLASPVLENLARGEFSKKLPAEGERAPFAALETFGRLMCGIAPWIELGGDGSEEGNQRVHTALLARTALAMAVDPNSPDFMNFNKGVQPLVDAAFLAQAILRAPVQLWQGLDGRTQGNLITALLSTRSIIPYQNNWLLFSAMIEALFYKLGLQSDLMRIDLALRTMESWYLGDGIYGDGPDFHWDYYNSFVIQPFMLDIFETIQYVGRDIPGRYARARKISSRYAAIQERLISPEGTYPPIGRSIVYRFGAFQLLSQMALRNELPPGVSPAQVRSALTAVIRRQMSALGTFDEAGWLNIGFAGNQPSLGEGYISKGSGYLCAAGLLALGLPTSHPFWSGPGQPWTSLKMWSGQDMPRDIGLYGKQL